MAKIYAAPKSWRQTINTIASTPGWSVSVTGGGHLRVQSPDGASCFLSKTQSDRRAAANAKAHLRRIGWNG